MAPEGKSILLITALLAIICVSVGAVIGGQPALWLGVIGLLPFAFSTYFFRDPRRQTPQASGIVVAPADGKIIVVDRQQDDPVVQSGQNWKISIFMSPFNVHVNRIPLGGEVEHLKYNSGQFLAAFDSRASQKNERQYIGIRSPFGAVGCVQIAGWLARRIVCHLHLRQQVVSGERFGMIRFGSRLDVYLPDSCDVQVHLGQKVRAGETIIGVFHEKN